MGDEEDLLAALGVPSVEDLFTDIPDEVRVDGLNLPEGLKEIEVIRHVRRVLAKNKTTEDMPTFLGAGLYDHFVPSAVSAIVGRSEFYTAYTPYQAELSQGLLQALWEYQSLVCELTGMDAANSSMYDGSTALGEAALMAKRITGRSEFLVPRALHWEKKSVLQNYAKGAGLKIVEVDYDRKTGGLNVDHLATLVGPHTAGVYLESPNFFGVFEDRCAEIGGLCTDTLFVVGVNPLSLAIVQPPRAYGADVVIGEGQVFGNALNFGGPLLGLFACREDYVWKMPGRVIGLTKDAEGRRAFCMTMQSREQHIRREKAMSNICTNESLLAVAAAVYLAVLGRHGLRRLAEDNIERARELARRLNKIQGFHAPWFRGHHFNEFVVKSDRPCGELRRSLLEKGIHCGLPITPHFPELGEATLFCTTEVHDQDDYDALVRTLGALA